MRYRDILDRLDESERHPFLKRALAGKWSASRLRHEIARNRNRNRQIPPPGLPPLPDRCRLLVSTAAIEPDSVDYILTEARASEAAYADLSKLAATVLRPGGSCLVLSHQNAVLDALDALGTHLTYHWTCCHQLHIASSSFRPLLWFVKGKYAGPWIGDVCTPKPGDFADRPGWGRL
jgi:hypothetical protein